MYYTDKLYTILSLYIFKYVHYKIMHYLFSCEFYTDLIAGGRMLQKQNEFISNDQFKE